MIPLFSCTNKKNEKISGKTPYSVNFLPFFDVRTKNVLENSEKTGKTSKIMGSFSYPFFCQYFKKSFICPLTDAFGFSLYWEFCSKIFIVFIIFFGFLESKKLRI